MRKRTGSAKGPSGPVLRASVGTRRSILALLAPALLAAAGKKKSASSDLYALIGCTVFRDPGFALRGAEVTLEPEEPVVNGIKLKPQKGLADARGEVVFRVAPIQAKYRITAVSPGMKPETKPAVTQGGEERIDVTFLLLPAPK